MSSAIIFSAASANFFWSTGGVTGVALDLELELDLDLDLGPGLELGLGLGQGLVLKVERRDGLAEDDTVQRGDIRAA